MTTPVGGQRLRLIKQNFKIMVEDSLRALGYMDDSWPLAPVTVTGQPFDPLVEIVPNKVHVSGDDIIGIEIELGSDLQENRWTFYVDIFAEKESVGISLAGDVRDILRGKMSTIGRNISDLNVLDYRQATPTHLFYVDIEDVDLQRVRQWKTPVNRNWWVVACVLIDTYDDDQDTSPFDDGEPDIEPGDLDGGGPDDDGDDVDGGGPDDDGDDFDGGSP